MMDSRAAEEVLPHGVYTEAVVTASNTAFQMTVTAGTSDYDDRNPVMDSIGAALLRYGLPVVVLLGTVGNALSFAVLLRKSMRSTPMYFYLTLLAVADTVVLYTSAFKSWIRLITQRPNEPAVEALHVSGLVCKLLTYLLLDALYLSAWLIVLVTVDRFLVVWFPFRGYLMMRIRQARAIAACLVVLVGLSNAHVFWTFELYDLNEPVSSSSSTSSNAYNETVVAAETGGNATTTRRPPRLTCDGRDDNFFMANVFEYVKLTSYCAVPFVIVLSLNVSIVARLRQSSSLLQSSAGRDHRDGGGGPHTTVSLKRRSTAMTTVKHDDARSSGSSSDATTTAQHQQQDRGSTATARQATNGGRGVHQVLRGRRDAADGDRQPVGVVTTRTTATGNHHHYDGDDVRPSCQLVGAAATAVTGGGTRVQLSSARSTEMPLGRQRRLTRMLLFVSFAWLLTAPFALHAVIVERVDLSVSTARLVKAICFMLAYVNHSTNFYLYCITGNRFRHELRAMFCGLARTVWSTVRWLSGCDRAPRRGGGGAGGDAMARYVEASPPPGSGAGGKTASGRLRLMANRREDVRASDNDDDELPVETQFGGGGGGDANMELVVLAAMHSDSS